MTPVCEIHDYHLLRHINYQAVNGFNMLCLDLQYMVVTNSTHPTKKKQLDSCEVIGNPNASFTVNIPTASQVYSTLRKVEKTGPDTSVTSFFEQSAHPVQVGGVATNVQEASAVLSTYDLRLILSQCSPIQQAKSYFSDARTASAQRPIVIIEA